MEYIRGPRRYGKGYKELRLSQVFESYAEDSRIDDSALLYRAARVRGSVLEASVTVGDFSRVDNSLLMNNCRIDRQNQIFSSKLGKYSYTGMNTVVMGANVGAFCSISWNVTIGGAEHDTSRVTQHAFLYNETDRLRPTKAKPPYDRFADEVLIGNDVWIAAGAVVLRGIQIGDGAVVGANAVVTKDVPPYAVVVGNPAKIVKYRFDNAIINALSLLKWWQWDDQKIKEHYSLLSQSPDLENLNKIIASDAE